MISNIAKKTTYLNHYSFHIMAPAWGYVTIKMSGRPPFPALVILQSWLAVSRSPYRSEKSSATTERARLGAASQPNCPEGHSFRAESLDGA